MAEPKKSQQSFLTDPVNGPYTVSKYLGGLAKAVAGCALSVALCMFILRKPGLDATIKGQAELGLVIAASYGGLAFVMMLLLWYQARHLRAVLASEGRSWRTAKLEAKQARRYRRFPTGSLLVLVLAALIAGLDMLWTSYILWQGDAYQNHISFVLNFVEFALSRIPGVSAPLFGMVFFIALVVFPFGLIAWIRQPPPTAEQLEEMKLEAARDRRRLVLPKQPKPIPKGAPPSVGAIWKDFLLWSLGLPLALAACGGVLYLLHLAGMPTLKAEGQFSWLLWQMIGVSALWVLYLPLLILEVWDKFRERRDWAARTPEAQAAAIAAKAEAEAAAAAKGKRKRRKKVS